MSCSEAFEAFRETTKLPDEIIFNVFSFLPYEEVLDYISDPYFLNLWNYNHPDIIVEEIETDQMREENLFKLKFAGWQPEFHILYRIKALEGIKDLYILYDPIKRLRIATFIINIIGNAINEIIEVKDGKRNGTTFSFFEHNGAYGYEISNYKNNLKEGHSIMYMGNVLISEELYHNDVIDGRRIVYYSNGNIKTIENFKNGQLSGFVKYMDCDGFITKLGEYRNGKFSGYNFDGIIKKEKIRRYGYYLDNKFIEYTYIPIDQKELVYRL